MATGGSVNNITVNDRTFRVAADADPTRDLGGFSSEIKPNGDSTAREIMTRKVWKLEGITVEIDPNSDDQEFLQDLANVPGYYAISIELVDQTVYQATGKPVGDLQASSMDASMSLSLSGPGRLVKQ